MNGSKRFDGAVAAATIRRVFLLGVLLLIHRYLALLIPWQSLAAAFAGGIGVGEILLKYRRRPRGYIVASVTAPLAVALAVLLGARVVAGAVRSVAVDEALLTVPFTIVIPAVIAAVVLVPEGIFRVYPGSRVLFAPTGAGIIVVLFWSQGFFDTTLFSHPLAFLIVAIVAGVLLLLHQRIEGNHRRDRFLLVVALLVALAAAFGGYRFWSERATVARGGLMRPDALHFDFADYIDLATEIGRRRDLILLYREDRMPPDRLLRRYVLGGYTERRGFYRLSPGEEPSPVPPATFSEVITEGFPATGEQEGSEVSGIIDQEFYLINIDPDAFLSAITPVAAEQIPTDALPSVTSAYRVRSVPPVTDRSDLVDVPWPEDLPRSWRSAYLSGSDDPAIIALAESIAASVPGSASEAAADGDTAADGDATGDGDAASDGYAAADGDTEAESRPDAESRPEAEEGENPAGYLETLVALERFFLENYYYSLNPGVAVDGDQISHFLFESKKGYCSYFAFAMAIMARSLDIPARVALGFFTDPREGVMGYYPVRADMAHAWVEVWFPGYGWVEFDPTSQVLAPDETFEYRDGGDREQLVALVEEILRNVPDQSGTLPPVGSSGGSDGEVRRSEVRTSLVLVILAGASIGVAFLLRHIWWCRLARANPRRAAEIIFRRFLVFRRRGIGVAGTRGETDETVPARQPPPYDRIGGIADRARYDRAFTGEDLDQLAGEIVTHLGHPPAGISRFRRILWFLRVSLPIRCRTQVRCRHRREIPSGTGRTVLLVALPLLTLQPDPVRVDAQIPGETEPAAETEVDADTESAAEQLLERIDTARDAGNYALALRRIAEGRRTFPDDYRFPRRAGELYYQEELFESALTAWQEALRLGAPTYPVRYDVSRALGRLNRNDPAITILEELHRRAPDDRVVADDLAWLYYKEHRLTEAATLLEGVLADHGPDRNVSMTLATVYAGMYRYDDAVAEYRSAIAGASEEYDRYFLSVAHYNESILHARFYRWDETEAAARRSMEMLERAGGFMIRSELRFRRLEFAAAEEDLRRAVLLDEDGTLATLSLAEHLTATGKPDEAIALLEPLATGDHEGWLYYFGTDPDRYQQQLYGALAGAYRAGARRDRVYRPGSIGKRVTLVLRGFARRVRSWYYRGLYRKLSIRVAGKYEAGSRPILAAWNRMEASSWVPAIALRHLAEAERHELPVNPAAEEDYRMVRATLAEDAAELMRFAAARTGSWDQAQRLAALVEVWRILGTRHRNTTDRGDGDGASVLSSATPGVAAAVEAWRMHPGVFPVEGLRVPMRIEVVPSTTTTGSPGRGPGTLRPRRTRRILHRLGIVHVSGSPLVLVLSEAEEGVVWRVSHTPTGDTITGGTAPLEPRTSGGDRRTLEAIAAVVIGDE
ncbi:MAG: transglutaminase domain-containing protein [Alkalispirochaeta sp.]